MKIIRIFFNHFRHMQGYGIGWNFRNSGEINVINKIYDYYSKTENQEVVIFDVGSNNGLWSIEVVKKFGNNLKLHIFEPQQKCYCVLIDKFDKTVRINRLALGVEEGSMTLFSNHSGSEIASLYEQDVYKGTNKSMQFKETINVTTIDKYCYEEKIHKINFLKLDVEGNELDVLKGSQLILTSSGIDFLQFEFGVPNLYSRTFLKDFFEILDNKYVIFRIANKRLYRLDKYSPELEIFQTTNYLCVNKGVIDSFTI
jgi:FkbM family methyltransferase